MAWCFSQLVLGCAVADLHEVRDGVGDGHGGHEAREAWGADESERERGGYPLGEAVGANQQLPDGEMQTVAVGFLLDLTVAA